jgi:hypothetical protein
MDDVRTSQEIHLWASVACYGMALLFCLWIMLVPHKKHTYGPPRPVTAIASLFHMWMMLVRHRKSICVPPRPVTGIDLPYLHSAVTGGTQGPEWPGRRDIYICERTKVWVMGLEENEARSDCAGEAQQQSYRPTAQRFTNDLFTSYQETDGDHTTIWMTF